MQLRGQIVLSRAIGIFSLPGSPLLHCFALVTQNCIFISSISSHDALLLLVPYLHALPVSHVTIPVLLGDLNLFPVMILSSSCTSPVFTSSTFKHAGATDWVLWSLSSTLFNFCPESPSFSVDCVDSLWRLPICLDWLMYVSKAALFSPPPTLLPYRPLSPACTQSPGNKNCRSNKFGTSTGFHLLFS